MIVVAIVGILAAIAVPNYLKIQCRAKQTEAKNALKAMLVAEDTYRTEYDTYVGGVEAGEILNSLVKGPKRRYDYSAVVVSASRFIGEARASPPFTGELSGDYWQVDEIGRLTNVTRGCD
jgi:type IV pilus assembly protein PilA